MSSALLRLVPPPALDFDDAVRRVRPRLVRYAVRRLGDAHEAEELVQEALLRAYTHRAQLATVEDLSAWSTVVTGRLVIDRLRVRGRCMSVADVPETGRVGRDTADVVVAREETRKALDALGAMPTRQASLLWAREVEGHSYTELCRRFGMSEPAVRSVLTRARKALRKQYLVRGGTLPVGGITVLAPWIAGLRWTARLRRTGSRLTAPAALGALGVTTLSGLLLSPFGATQAPGSPTFPAGKAVITHLITAAAASPTARQNPLRPTVPLVAMTVLGPTTASVGTPSISDKGALRRINRLPCAEPAGHVGVGGSRCKGGSRVSVTDLPPNPTHYETVSVVTNDVACAQISIVTTHVPRTTCTQGESR